MKRILICVGDNTLEALLAIVVERLGHETALLPFAPRELPGRGDVLLVDLSAPHGLAWVQSLRRLDPGLPVVAIGLEPGHRRALGFAPTAVVPKPFALDELRAAVEQALA